MRTPSKLIRIRLDTQKKLKAIDPEATYASLIAWLVDCSKRKPKKTKEKRTK